MVHLISLFLPMNYQLTQVINTSREVIIEALFNKKQYGQWMAYFVDSKMITTDAQDTGAQCELLFNQNGREIIVIETLQEQNLPEECLFSYDESTGKFSNKIRYQLQAIKEDETALTVDYDVHYESFAMKFLLLFFPKAFRDQSLQDLERLKTCCEEKG